MILVPDIIFCICQQRFIIKLYRQVHLLMITWMLLSDCSSTHSCCQHKHLCSSLQLSQTPSSQWLCCWTCLSPGLCYWTLVFSSCLVTVVSPFLICWTVWPVFWRISHHQLRIQYWTWTALASDLASSASPDPEDQTCHQQWSSHWKQQFYFHYTSLQSIIQFCIVTLAVWADYLALVWKVVCQESWSLLPLEEVLVLISMLRSTHHTHPCPEMEYTSW